jgi:hypothetical protein
MLRHIFLHLFCLPIISIIKRSNYKMTCGKLSKGVIACDDFNQNFRM